MRGLFKNPLPVDVLILDEGGLQHAFSLFELFLAVLLGLQLKNLVLDLIVDVLKLVAEGNLKHDLVLDLISFVGVHLTIPPFQQLQLLCLFFGLLGWCSCVRALALEQIERPRQLNCLEHVFLVVDVLNILEQLLQVSRIVLQKLNAENYGDFFQ